MKITLILPKDKTILKKKYAEVMAEIVAKRLTNEELKYLIDELEKKEKQMI